MVFGGVFWLDGLWLHWIIVNIIHSTCCLYSSWASCLILVSYSDLLMMKL